MDARTALSGAGDAALESPKTTARSNVAEGEVMGARFGYPASRPVAEQICF